MARMAPFTEVKQVLTKLSPSYRMAIITNGMPAAQTEKVERLRFGHYFETVIASADVGIGKPAAEIFQHALAHVGVTAGESVMVGDSLEGDVEGAREVGMPACWVRRDAPTPENDDANVPTIHDLSGLEPLLGSSLGGDSPWADAKAVSSTQ